MKPFREATISEDEIQRNIADYVKAWTDRNPEALEMIQASDAASARAAIVSMFREIHRHEKIWLNDRYQVNVRRCEAPGEGQWPAMLHLSIKRIDRSPVHDWRDLQEIKNMIVGPECEAVELYPAESRKVDTANQYHLWVIETPDIRFPFGFVDRLVLNSTFSKAKQRPL